MGTIKKYNQDSKKWTSFASSYANQITTSSTKLVGNGEEVTDVETVLENLTDSIKTLKGNVAWLALHGGGGSGSGSGGGGGQGGGGVTGAILVNDVETGGRVVLTRDNQGIQVTIQANTSSINWDIVVTSGTTTLANVTGRTSVTINRSALSELGQNFGISISAKNSATLTNLYWNGRVYISSATLTVDKESMNVNVNNVSSSENTLTYRFSVGIEGSYTLIVTPDNKQSRNITIPVSASQTGAVLTRTVTISDLGFTEADFGSTNIKAYLQKDDDSTVKSTTVTTAVSIVSDANIVVSTTMSTDQNNPEKINQDKNLNIPFTAYYGSGASFQYTIEVSGKGLSGETVTKWIGVPDSNGYPVATSENPSCIFGRLYGENYISARNFAASDSASDNILRIIIRVKSADGLTAESKPIYVKVLQSEFQQLETPIEASLLSDFRVFEEKAGRNVWEAYNDKFEMNSDQMTITQPCTVYNPNSYSGLRMGEDSPNFFRLQNKAYAVLGPWNYGNNLSGNFRTFIDSTAQFTINICYKVDFHPDDDRTIFQFGKLNRSNELLSGILLSAHSLQVKSQGGDRTVVLVDNEIIDINIAVERISENNNVTDRITIYVNGVSEAVTEIQNFIWKRDTTSTDYIWDKENIYLGCSYNNREYFNFTDVSFYRIMFYNKRLTDYEILFNYLNNMSFSHYNDSGSPDTNYIKEGLERNFISYNQTSGKAEESYLWNTNDNKYDISKFVVGGELVAAGTLDNYSLPIPLMLIDVTTSSDWTWENFITPKGSNASKLPSVEGARVQYYSKGHDICDMICKIDLQGTSTLSDNIKNLNISFEDYGNGRQDVFIPKETWLPELKYTLKADIVDSSHSINAAIGKFINEELGSNVDASGNATNRFFPFNSKVVTSFENSGYHRSYPKATLKHAIEGFPIFVILKTRARDDEGGTSFEVHTLGIYQFILGRDSERNLGYKTIERITDRDGNDIGSVTYPFYARECQITETIIGGYWLEASDNPGFGGKLEGETDDDVKNKETVDYISWPGVNNADPAHQLKDKLYGALFWQDDDNFLNSIIDIKYALGVGGGPVAANATDIPLFKKLVEEIIKLPIAQRHYSTLTDKIAVDYIDRLEYFKYNYDSSSATWSPAINGSGQQETYKFEEQDDNVDISLYLNLESAYKYFIIAMMFGLTDNFQKNMPIKWFGDPGTDQQPDTVNRQAILGVYDCDTGLGGDNQANLNITEDLWLAPLKNYSNVSGEEGFAITEALDGQNSKILGYGNKLWMSLMGKKATHFAPESNGSYTKSIYSDFWCRMRNYMATRISTYNRVHGTNYTSLADYFMDVYFVPQTQGCGELLFNLTYNAKYIQKYTADDGTMKNQIAKLNGRRIMQARRWLKHHITFLDSMFEWMKVKDSASPETEFSNVPDYQGTTTAVVTASLAVRALPIQVNSPVVLSVGCSGSSDVASFCRMPKYGQSRIYFGNGSDRDDPSKQHTIPFANNILELGNDDITLSDTVVGSISGSLPLLTEFNLSGSEKLSGTDAFDLRNLFTIANSTISELRVVDLSNTKFMTGSGSLTVDFNYSPDGINYYTNFTKLQTINIENSCVTSISLPNVPLDEFKCSKSQIQSISLDKQNFLTTLNLSECRHLRTVSVTNCNNFHNLSLDNTNQELTTVTIAGCADFRSFTCESNATVYRIVLNNNPLLETVTITSCPELIELDLSNCTSLKSIVLTGCTKLTEIKLPENMVSMPNLTTINFRNTSVKKILYGTYGNDDYLDLSRMTNLTNFDIRNNENVVNIKFNNNADIPIPINVPFSGCTKLTRIYGHIKINSGATSTFRNCSNFSIHGVGTTQYNGKNILDSSGRVQLPYEVDKNVKLTETSTSIDASYKPTFQNQDLRTNITFGNVSLANMFEGTSCTTFDIYYVLSSVKYNTSLSRTWNNLTDNPFYWTSSVDNSPNRYMFYWCGSYITNCGETFRAIQNKNSSAHPKYIRLFSPTNDRSTVSKDNGLFSPLTNLTSISWMWDGYSYLIDRFVFRRASGNYAISAFNDFNPVDIYSETNSESYVKFDSISNYASKINGTTITIDSFGNLSNFFNNLPSISNATYIFNTRFLNYDTIQVNQNQTYVYASYNASYGYSEGFSLSNIFATNKANVTAIKASFRVSNTATLGGQSIRVEFPISESTLSGFSNLEYIGYNNTGTEGGISSFKDQLTGSSFYGNGIHKYCTGSTFPYGIVGTNTKLKHFTAFFSNCYADQSNSTTFTGATPELPGEMFRNNTKLESVAGLFYGAKFTYTLGTNNVGFSNCNNLDDVSYLFGAPADVDGVGTLNYLSGSIPLKLFYHGSNPTLVTKTLRGLSGASVVRTNNVRMLKGTTVSSVTEYKITKSGGVVFYQTYGPAGVEWWSDRETRDSYVNESGATITGNFVVYTNNLANDFVKYSTTTVTYTQHYNRITNISNCFRSANIQAFEHQVTSSDIEKNPNYNPYNCQFTGTGWVEATVDNNVDTEIWAFDGDKEHSLALNGRANTENLDGSVDYNGDKIIYSYNDLSENAASSVGGVINYICAPDLFRYCSDGQVTGYDTCDVSYIFANCGRYYSSDTWGSEEHTKAKNYGLHGRIVPYLLKPFEKSTGISLDGMFINCKLLSNYTASGTNTKYIIPATFFNYCINVTSLNRTFQGLVFGPGTSLNVFSSINASKLSNISRIFYQPRFHGSSSNPLVISNIFSKFGNLTDVSYAFAVGDSDYRTATEHFGNQYVKFERVFKPNTYTSQSNSTFANTKGTNQFYKVFAYYNKNYVTFETLTLVNTQETANYRYWSNDNSIYTPT